MFNPVRSVSYDHNDGMIIYRTAGMTRSFKLSVDGFIFNQYEVSGDVGLTVDTQGYVHVSERNKSEIHRLRILPDGRFRDMHIW